MEYLLPRLDGGGTPNFEWLFDGIVGEGPGGSLSADQFDDWLVDPIYFEDIRLDRQLFVDQLEVAWRGGTLKSAAPTRFPVPRENGRSLKAMALPLSLRLATHATIADAAPKLMRGHLRDKILGFGFHDGRVPAFDAPVDGAEELEIAAVDLLEVGYGDPVTVVDVTAFQNSATPERLQTVMTTAGVIDEQVRFLSSLLASNHGGLPTIDDAFAFLYNSYLRPVDAAVAQSGTNFFRHRDEYFLLDPDAVSIVEAGLTSIGLSGRHKVRELDTEEARYVLEERAQILQENTEAEHSLDEYIGQVGMISLWAGWAAPWCESDCFELYFSVDPGRTRSWFFDACQSGNPVDAVRALPVIRDFHRARHSLAWRLPPFGNVPSGTAEYMAQIATQHDALKTALMAGTHENAPWQTSWATLFLSDLGSPDTETTDAWLSTAKSNLVPAEEAARLALARASTISASDFWPGFDGSIGPFARRSRALAAWYLAQRGETRPFDDAKADIAETEPSLIRFLDRL